MKNMTCLGFHCKLEIYQVFTLCICWDMVYSKVPAGSNINNFHYPVGSALLDDGNTFVKL